MCCSPAAQPEYRRPRRARAELGRNDQRDRIYPSCSVFWNCHLAVLVSWIWVSAVNSALSALTP
jgi:hypothetical protein